MRNLEREKENVETNFYLVFLTTVGLFLGLGLLYLLDFIGFNIDNSDNILVVLGICCGAPFLFCF